MYHIKDCELYNRQDCDGKHENKYVFTQLNPILYAQCRIFSKPIPVMEGFQFDMLVQILKKSKVKNFLFKISRFSKSLKVDKQKRKRFLAIAVLSFWSTIVAGGLAYCCIKIPYFFNFIIGIGGIAILIYSIVWACMAITES